MICIGARVQFKSDFYLVPELQNGTGTIVGRREDFGAGIEYRIKLDKKIPGINHDWSFLASEVEPLKELVEV